MRADEIVERRHRGEDQRGGRGEDEAQAPPRLPRNLVERVEEHGYEKPECDGETFAQREARET